MTWQILLVAIGATLRLTRLITQDTISAPLRRWAARRDATHRADSTRRRTAAAPNPDGGPWFLFITCPWCVSMYVAFGVFGLYAITPHDLRPCLALLYAALSASLIAGIVLASKERHP